jgi:hypothetical protein
MTAAITRDVSSARAATVGNVTRSGKEPLARFDAFIGGFLAIVAAGHIALTLAVPNLAEKFQLGDRAGDRLAKLNALLQAPNADAIAAALVYNDSPGDYVLFWPAYSAFGPAGVIAQNLLLLLVGLWFLYRIGVTWFSPTVAKIACIVYALLPAMIFHPQVLVSEAICNPLLIAATWYAGPLVTRDRPALRDAILFGLICAVLIAVREIFLLFPVVVAGLVVLKAGKTRQTLTVLGIMLALSFSIFALWGTVRSLAPARYERGISLQSLPSNLFLRAERMAAIGSFELPQDVSRQRAISIAEFAELGLHHPGPLARTVISDAVDLTANTGSAMVYGRYLGLFDLGERSSADIVKWREIRDRSGTLAMLAYMSATAPAALAYTVGFAIGWGIFLMIVCYGAWRFARGCQPLELKRLFFAIPAYFFIFSFVSGAPRWDHRSPVEFVLCLFFALGAVALVAWLRGKRMQRPIL